MKELSIEEKAYRYDKAIKVAKSNYETIVQMDNDCTFAKEEIVNTFHHMFPELAENEDEMIRKLLIEAVIQVLQDQYCSNRGVSKEKVVAWLEKQGEHTKFLNKIQIGDKVTRNQDGVLVNLSQLQRVAKPAETYKQGEQKPTDNIEPKFKVGDWIIKDNYSAQQVKELREEAYILDGSISGVETLPKKYIENNYHLWTIQDAKEGDVILDNYPFIFKKTKYNSKHCYAFCGIGQDGNFMVNPNNWYGKEDSSEVWTWGRDLKPATKEQRDFLFKKMKEAGYEWNAEKKELKKIEQKPAEYTLEQAAGIFLDALSNTPYNNKPITDAQVITKELLKFLEDTSSYNPNAINEQKPVEWSEEDKVILNNIIWCVHMKSIKPLDEMDDRNKYKKYEDFLKSLPTRFSLHPKQEWSEEDYNEIETIACHLDNTDNEGMAEVLRNIRDKYYIIPQNTWKPSDEQMDALHYVTNFDYGGNKATLVSLYEQLKKLREG